MSESKKFLGTVVVSSGQLLITDPAAIKYSWIDAGNSSWTDICHATATDARCGQVLEDNALAINADLGDGTYNVYAVKDELGYTEKLEISILPDVIDDDDDYDDMEDWIPEDEEDWTPLD
jgi:hypothetical protein